MTRKQKETTQNKERGIQIAAKVLILVPFITFIVFLLALVALASPIGLMVFMGYRFKLQAAEKAEPFFEFLTRPVRKLSARRHDSYIDLLNETNMVVGPRPSADTYYDSKARIKFENAEVFSNSEM